MSTFRDLLRVSLSGLAARKMRTVLLLLGPMIGVAAIIAAVGLTDSPATVAWLARMADDDFRRGLTADFGFLAP